MNCGRTFLQGFEFSALVESDPAIKLLEVAAYRETILRARVNDAFKATLLAFAAGNDLDNLAAFYGLTRLAQETDAELKDRTINRIQGSSTAGGAAWYRYQALTANDPRRAGDQPRRWPCGGGAAEQRDQRKRHRPGHHPNALSARWRTSASMASHTTTAQRRLPSTDPSGD